MKVYYITSNDSKAKEVKARLPDVRRVDTEYEEIQTLSVKEVVEEAAKRVLQRVRQRAPAAANIGIDTALNNINKAQQRIPGGAGPGKAGTGGTEGTEGEQGQAPSGAGK